MNAGTDGRLYIQDTTYADNEPVKITLVITELDPGGAERNLVKLACAFQSAGHSPVVVSIASQPNNKTLLNSLEKRQIPVLFLDIDSKWRLPIAIWKLKRVLKQEMPDILQSFLYHANIVTSLSNLRMKIPHFVGLRVRDPRAKRYRRLARYQRRWAGVVSVSKDVQQFAQMQFDLPSTLFHTIPNGVELEVIDQARQTPWPADLPTSSLSLVFIGRLDPQKGVDLLLANLRALLAKDGDCRIFIIGQGPMKKEIEQYVLDKGLHDRVHLLGFRDDVLCILNRSTLLLFPSRWEGMPNVVMEAMACGIPVITTPVEGIDELLGLDSQQVATESDWGDAAIRAMSMPTEERLALGATNRLRIEEAFTSSHMSCTYLNVYAQELEGK